MYFHFLFFFFLFFAPLNFTYASDLTPREGWVVLKTDKSASSLISSLRRSAKQHSMNIVTQAGPTKAAKARGITIPENRVIGVFNNDFAVKILSLSTAAMIEAPIRFYITGDSDGTATLSYKTPNFIFAPYFPEGGESLQSLSSDLTTIFRSIAEQTVSR